MAFQHAWGIDSKTRHKALTGFISTFGKDLTNVGGDIDVFKALGNAGIKLCYRYAEDEKGLRGLGDWAYLDSTFRNSDWQALDVNISTGSKLYIQFGYAINGDGEVEFTPAIYLKKA